MARNHENRKIRKKSLYYRRRCYGETALNRIRAKKFRDKIIKIDRIIGAIMESEPNQNDMIDINNLRELQDYYMLKYKKRSLLIQNFIMICRILSGKYYNQWSF